MIRYEHANGQQRHCPKTNLPYAAPRKVLVRECVQHARNAARLGDRASASQWLERARAWSNFYEREVEANNRFVADQPEEMRWTLGLQIQAPYPHDNNKP